jgi:hypothetical protein
MVSIELRTINRMLRWLGLVLVVGIDAAGKVPTRLWIETFKHYQTRVSQGAA